MHYRIVIAALAAASLLSGTELACAAKADPSSKAASAASASSASSAKGTQANKAAAAIVDINTASAKELTKLPGINGALAAKIIEGRPYGSKAQLVSHKILDEATYEGIRVKIAAVQSEKTVSGLAASANKTK
jgi:DNA uptake protein ComE-like DNA-binding protein